MHGDAFEMNGRTMQTTYNIRWVMAKNSGIGRTPGLRACHCQRDNNLFNFATRKNIMG